MAWSRAWRTAFRVFAGWVRRRIGRSTRVWQALWGWVVAGWWGAIALCYDDQSVLYNMQGSLGGGMGGFGAYAVAQLVRPAGRGWFCCVLLVV